MSAVLLQAGEFAVVHFALDDGLSMFPDASSTATYELSPSKA